MLSDISYYSLKEKIKLNRFPLAMVDLDAVDKNFEFFSSVAKKNNKKIRIASKSIRVPFLIKYIMEKDKDLFSGIMCYRISEAEFLFNYGLDNFFVGYPDLSDYELDKLFSIQKKGANISLAIDSIEHIDIIQKKAEENDSKIKIVIDIDASLRFLDSKINLGVRRSSIKNLETLEKLLLKIKESKNVQLEGIMLYEAQIAGVTDNGSYKAYENIIKTQIKKISIPKVENFRKACLNLVKKHGFEIEIINGGGTGSIFSTALDDSVTEVTIGSGFLCSHLFSNYKTINLTPALFFALQVVRKPSDDYITCLGGGFIASGSIGKDKQPEVFLPKGIEVTDLEGFGEVQTPFKIKDKITKIAINDPVILRPSKAGEIAEHFLEYIIFKNNEFFKTEKTYRGYNCCFL
ncbi:MAG: alanine racemase [Cyanobacteriota bacterium]